MMIPRKLNFFHAVLNQHVLSNMQNYNYFSSKRLFTILFLQLAPTTLQTQNITILVYERRIYMFCFCSINSFIQLSQCSVLVASSWGLNFLWIFFMKYFDLLLVADLYNEYPSVFRLAFSHFISLNTMWHRIHFHRMRKHRTKPFNSINIIFSLYNTTFMLVTKDYSIAVRTFSMQKLYTFYKT